MMMNRRVFVLTAFAAAGLPRLRSITVADLKPRDVIVIQTEHFLSQAETDRMQKVLREKFPANEILILGPGVTMTIARS